MSLSTAQTGDSCKDQANEQVGILEENYMLYYHNVVCVCDILFCIQLFQCCHNCLNKVTTCMTNGVPSYLYLEYIHQCCVLNT